MNNMKTFNQFKELLLEVLTEFFPECEVHETVVSHIKGYESTIAFSIIPDTGLNGVTIYPEPIFQSMKERNANVDETISLMIENIKKKINKFQDETDFFVNTMENITKEELLTDLIASLISVKGNREMLENCPHALFSDELAIVFRKELKTGEEGCVSCIISNEIMSDHQITDIKELCDAAKESAQREPILSSFLEEFEQYLKESGTTNQKIETILGVLNALPGNMKNSLFFVTTKNHYFSAIVMTNKDSLKKIAEELQSGFFIFPSNVHRLIIYAADKSSNYELALKVAQTSTNFEDQALNNAIYYYDKESEELINTSYSF